MAQISVPSRINLPLSRRLDWPATLLLIAAMLTAATRLVVTKWTADLSLVQTVTLFGVIVGMALGISRFSGRSALFFAFLYGLFITPWQIGLVQQSEPLWSDKLSTIAYRLTVIIYQLIHKQTVMDSLLFIVLMCILFWALSVYAGYSVAREGDPWKAIVPTGLALFVIQYYDPAASRRAWYLAFFIFFGLVLVARLAFVQEHSRWQNNRTALPPHLSLDFIRFAVLFASAIVILSWTAPAVAQALPAAQKLWEPVRSRWNDTVSDMNYAFASLRTSRQILSPVYGNSAVLGRGTPLGNTQMFTVQAPIDAPSSVRYYWRARTYDVYQDGQWFSSTNQNRVFDPGLDTFADSAGVGRWEGKFKIISGVNMGSIFTPPQPMWVSRSGQMQYLPNTDGTIDVSGFISEPGITAGQIYEVRSSISNPTIIQMRQAGSDYPAWVADRYLQLPAGITPRTRQLAQEITQGIDNPYDRVAAVTNYLRENMTYVQSIEENPTPGQDLVDWFLFDLKKGFCNYYATSEVVLLRSLGIPARWSIGYAQGELVENRDDSGDLLADNLTYVVRNRDAHSWPEVYFPSIGWVEFEPTVSQPDIQRVVDNQTNSLLDINGNTDGRDTGLTDLNKNTGDQGSPEQIAFRQSLLKITYWSAGILAGLILILALGLRYLPMFGLDPAAVLLRRLLERIGVQPPETVQKWADKAAKAPPPKRIIRFIPLPVLLERALLRLGARPPMFLRQWARYVQLPPLARAYNEINIGLSRLGSRPAATATPIERAVSLGILAPAADDSAQVLVYEYQLEVFGRGSADLPKAQQAAKTVRSQTYRALFGRVLARFQRDDEQKRSLRGLK